MTTLVNMYSAAHGDHVGGCCSHLSDYLGDRVHTYVTILVSCSHLGEALTVVFTPRWPTWWSIGRVHTSVTMLAIVFIPLWPHWSCSHPGDHTVVVCTPPWPHHGRVCTPVITLVVFAPQWPHCGHVRTHSDHTGRVCTPVTTMWSCSHPSDHNVVVFTPQWPHCGRLHTTVTTLRSCSPRWPRLARVRTPVTTSRRPLQASSPRSCTSTRSARASTTSGRTCSGCSWKSGRARSTIFSRSCRRSSRRTCWARAARRSRSAGTSSASRRTPPPICSRHKTDSYSSSQRLLRSPGAANSAGVLRSVVILLKSTGFLRLAAVTPSSQPYDTSYYRPPGCNGATGHVIL